MDRQLHRKFVPPCPRNPAIVDQYMWPEKDTNKYQCTNGISHPIYDCKGWVNFSLPLEEYPPVNQIHPQIGMSRRMHLNYRGNPTAHIPVHKHQAEYFEYDEDRVEGMYLPKTGFYTVTDKVPGYPLPNPYGNNRGRSACNCG